MMKINTVYSLRLAMGFMLVVLVVSGCKRNTEVREPAPGKRHDSSYVRPEKRTGSTAKKAGSAERKQKPAPSVTDTKEPKLPKEPKTPSETKEPNEPKAPQDAKGSTEPKKDESRRLRDKLEAIRAMERKMDEAGGGN